MKRVLDKDKTCYRIRELCNKHNVSIAMLTEELFVSPQTVYGWFSAQKMPSIDHMVEIAAMLDTSLDDLVQARECRA